MSLSEYPLNLTRDEKKVFDDLIVECKEEIRSKGSINAVKLYRVSTGATVADSIRILKETIPDFMYEYKDLF